MELTRDELLHGLRATGPEEEALLAEAVRLRDGTVGRRVFLRGLIELSNVCGKDCLYCGIRAGNGKAVRYALSEKTVLDTVGRLWDEGYGSVVLQAGEDRSPAFTSGVERLVRGIARLSGGRMGVTLSLGERSSETYRRWREAGAHRYLLRIETSSPRLYGRLHPRDGRHRWQDRLEALHALRRTGYQVGTGVMIGLPFQQTGDLADDLLFMRELDIDMCGMGPYIEHPDTPLAAAGGAPLPLSERFRLSLRMIALLRRLMPDINIAATTALQAIDPLGREKALEAGTNVMMPNATPARGRLHYRLYPNKPGTAGAEGEGNEGLPGRLQALGYEVPLGEAGDPLHYRKRTAP